MIWQYICELVRVGMPSFFPVLALYLTIELGFYLWRKARKDEK
jgi:hypothetical protein